MCLELVDLSFKLAKLHCFMAISYKNSWGYGKSKMTYRFDSTKVPVFKTGQISLGMWRDGIAVRAPSGLGDAVMSIPAMMQLKKTIPWPCGIYVVSSSALEPLFRSLDFVDDVIALDGNGTWSRREIKLVNRVHTGVGIIFRDSFLDAFYMKLALIPRLFGPAAKGNSIFLEKTFDFSKHENLHNSFRYMSIAYSLGTPQWDGIFPVLRDLKEPEITDPKLENILGLENLLLVAPGATYGPAKEWPVDNFSELICAWTEDFKGSCVISGTSSEKKICDSIKAELKSKKVFNLAGKLDLYDLIKLVRKAKGCVSNDNGLMHLAAAAGCPGAAIFGPSDPELNGPMSNTWSVLQGKKECPPCFARKCPKGTYDCYADITTEALIPELQRFHQTITS